ncbi:MAG: S49 family peptidase [Gammaproteobacteria bacterium]|nr:S49 family peptidase [Gammaproteobacteria bacterium]
MEEKRSGWEQELVERLATESLREQRRARWWGILFKSLTFLYLVLLLVLWWPDTLFDSAITTNSHTALIELSGIISDDSKASADNIVTGLRNAFEDDNTKGVVIRINSPGGSAVQSGMINDEIKRLKEENPDIPVYAVVTDICASGGYYIAAAADRIYVDKASIVGSVGVLMSSFGFVGTMKLVGVERRLMTAGEHKAIMDPFTPLPKSEKAHIQNMLDGIHRQFITVVKEGRGDRLKGGDELFSGLFWTGEEAVELGLADELGSASYVAREVIKHEELVDFTPSDDFLDRFAKKIGASAASTLMNLIGSERVPQLLAQ